MSDGKQWMDSLQSGDDVTVQLRGRFADQHVEALGDELGKLAGMSSIEVFCMLNISVRLSMR